MKDAIDLRFAQIYCFALVPAVAGTHVIPTGRKPG